MDSLTVLLVMFALITKHFVVDFPLQSFPYQYQNKGTYGHLGGILHATLHLIGSLVVLLPILGYSALLVGVCVGEAVAHYHIDWAKMNINEKLGWKCNTSQEFWTLLGVDQYAHYVTYLLMIIILM